MERSDLHNLRALIVEDLGCTVAGVAGSLKDALAKAAAQEFDVAILDMNLNGAPATPVAELLTQRGIPFMFLTGYGATGVPEAFKGIPVVQKPFNDADFGRTLGAAIKSNVSL
jgi:CheY-like chemotaxis protein